MIHGSYRMVKRSHRQWFTLQITQHTQIKPGESKLSSSNRAYVQYPELKTNVKANVILTQPAVAWSKFLRGNPTFSSRNLWSKRSLKQLGSCVFFCQSFTASWTSLNSSRALSRNICDNCDYTFDTLKENMPKALALVKLVTICWWEHQMQQWMEAYQSGLTTTDVQRKVKEFSSAKYTSHRCIPIAIMCAMDWHAKCCVPMCEISILIIFSLPQFWHNKNSVESNCSHHWYKHFYKRNKNSEYFWARETHAQK
jgi:hypothetical protein